MAEGSYPLLLVHSGQNGNAPARRFSDLITPAFFDWFHSVRAERVADLLNFYNLSMPPQTEDIRFLLDLGKNVAHSLRNTPFMQVESGKTSPTPQGYALAHDMALLVAELIILRAERNVRWRRCDLPESSWDHHYPILISPPGRTYWSPIRVGITRLYSILDGTIEGDCWARDFVYWREYIKTGSFLEEAEAMQRVYAHLQ